MEIDSGPNYNLSTAGNPREWEISLFGCGECTPCLYAWCCTPCARAEARQKLDGSDWCTNCCFVSSVGLRWMARSAYKIDGTAQSDCCVGLCCQPCVVNQVLQTVNKRGKAKANQVGPGFNVNEREGFKYRSCLGSCYDCTYTCCCPICARGFALRSTGMPFWFGCCCIGTFEANTILRYHHRIRPCYNDESVPDCVIPLLSTLCAAPLGIALFAYTYGQLVEENVRSRQRDCFYGFDILLCCAKSFGFFCGGCSCNDIESGRYLFNYRGNDTASVAFANTNMNDIYGGAADLNSGGGYNSRNNNSNNDHYAATATATAYPATSHNLSYDSTSSYNNSNNNNSYNNNNNSASNENARPAPLVISESFWD